MTTPLLLTLARIAIVAALLGGLGYFALDALRMGNPLTTLTKALGGVK